MNFLKKIVIVLVLFLLTSCSKEKNQARLIFTLENSKIEVSDFKICKTEYGFEISIGSSLQKTVASQKVKTFFLEKDNKKIEIKTFNILYTPPQDYQHKAPTKPNGSLAFFKSDNEAIIDVLSDKKEEIINLIGKDKVSNCASH